MKDTEKPRITALLLAGFVLLSTLNAVAQEKATEAPVPEFQMTVLKQIPATSVKSQASTSTCWCFATTSMLESELMRLGKGEIGLSEMFTVNNTYLEKAKQYVRFHGTCNFAEGGEQHDVLNSIAKYGLVPREIYPGINYGEKVHKHGELIGSLTAVLQTLIKNPNEKLSPVWLKGVEGVLDAYLGEKPEKFSHNGKMVTPREFASELGINPDDYIEFSSFSHHPFYSRCILEMPDNWSQALYYNVPIDELMEIVDYALSKGISIGWGADISDLNIDAGVARIMEDGKSINNPTHPEKQVSQQDRQYMFESWQLTDDHIMHLCGIAQDQFGNKFYLEKNSWGERGLYKGYSYVSVPFMRMRTMSIMVHKDGIPPSIAQKVGLK